MKNRFKKHQIIFKVEVHNNRAIEIHEKEVISCGAKVLKLKGKWNNDDFRINTMVGFFSGIGCVGNMIEQFHETKDLAQKEMDKYNSNL